MDGTFEYVFPAIRGIQAGREYYVSMCPLRLIPRIFLFDEAELVPELRAQRQLNRGRLPELARYVTQNPNTYVFSAITCSMDADVQFVPNVEETDAAPRRHAAGMTGSLRVPMNARFVINDGQHRRAAIEMALRERPELADESIAVVFFHDRGLERCQQMFADLNRHAIRPSRSLNVLYDHRDEKARLAKLAVAGVPGLDALVEMERSTLSAGSRKLLTLSALCTATGALLVNHEDLGDRRDEVVIAFWREVHDAMPLWQEVRRGELSAGALRADYLHAHGVVLHALGRVGNSLLHHHSKDWRKRLAGIRDIDWRRSSAQWEGRATIGGNAVKSAQNVILTTNAIKRKLALSLTPEEQRLEDAMARGDRDARAA